MLCMHVSPADVSATPPDSHWISSCKPCSTIQVYTTWCARRSGCLNRFGRGRVRYTADSIPWICWHLWLNWRTCEYPCAPWKWWSWEVECRTCYRCNWTIPLLSPTLSGSILSGTAARQSHRLFSLKDLARYPSCCAFCWDRSVGTGFGIRFP